MSGSKKAKLSALNQYLSNFKCKGGTIWFVLKQVWYIPFLWSLAWYSYWIFRNAIVLKTPLLEGNILDYLGAALSIAALLFAGYRARTPIKRSVEAASARLPFQKNHLAKSGQNQPLPQRPVQNVHIEPTKQIRPPQLKQQPIEPNRLQKETMLTQKPLKSTPNNTAFSSNIAQSGKGHASKSLESECLTCAKLIDCTYRQRRALELRSGTNVSSCSYAAKLQSCEV
jgi:hypothetical protein